MSFPTKILFLIILFCIVITGCNKEEVDLNYSIETITADSETNLNQMFFLNDDIGFLVGGQRGKSGTVYKSIDGGQTWSVNLCLKKSLYAVNFLSDSVGYACGESLILLKTYDQGVSWEDYQFPYYPDYSYQVPFKDIDFVDEATVYLTGGMYFDRGLMAKSSNGGQWWDWDIFDYELSSAHFFNPEYGILSGYGHFTVTRDGAEAFEVVDFKGDFFTSIYFLDETVGFASGYDGGIYKTENAGNQWEVLINSNSLFKKRVHLNDIHMINADKGISVGNKGVICLTYDGGINWKSLIITEELDCFSIFSTGYKDEIVITCSEGKVIKLKI